MWSIIAFGMVLILQIAAGIVLGVLALLWLSGVFDDNDVP
jgi:hypothetical protein